jgi:hypothetical protein
VITHCPGRPTYCLRTRILRDEDQLAEAGWNVTENVGSWFRIRHLTEVDPRPTRLGTPKLALPPFRGHGLCGFLRFRDLE